MDLYETHKDRRERFEILAIHGGGKTLAELDEKLKPLAEQHWQGRTLPFPILIDGEGKTFKAFGIWGIPFDLLLDPEGNIVKDGSVKLLAISS
jgi:hypothetical protein